MAIRLGGFTSLVHECEMETVIQDLAHNRKSEGATAMVDAFNGLGRPRRDPPRYSNTRRFWN